GLGCLCTYASYFEPQTSISRTAFEVCTIDTLIALMAGFIIFPAAAASGYHLQPGDIGPSLIFITLPNVFQMAFHGLPWVAYIFSVMFYVLLILAALTSTISMHEIVTSYMTEEFNLPRKKGAVFETGIAIVLGILCSLSFGLLGDIHIFGMTIFDLFDWAVSNLCMPLGGMLISIFTGWYLDKKVFRDELTNYGENGAPYVRGLIFTLRYITPLAIFLIFLNQFGVFNFG
ncbi:MAG: sodium-dependent transporter, partial [Bacteroidaceae bacterium]|nr:sodium-dependent transporter [Bacteroidaceae bacterium]